MNQAILTYLTELENNNNRDWYHSHIEDYRKAQSDFEELIRDLIIEIGKFDSSILHNEPKNLTFKLRRDTRFSNNKSPYNAAFRCHISEKGKLPVPTGYFLFIKPNNQSFLGGGLFADMFKSATQMIRDYIFHNAEEFLDIVQNPEFSKMFKIDGVALKNVPKEYPADCAVAEYLKYKSWFIEYHIDDAQFENDEEFVLSSAKVFEAMKPFNDFLNRALVGFSMPRQ